MEGHRGIVLDTDILVDVLRGKRKAIEIVRRLRSGRLDIATTVVNIFELSWGAHKLGGERIRDVERLADTLTLLNFTSREAVKAGEEIAYLESIGLTISIRDLLIGIITRENNYTLMTGNIKHFSRIKDLKILPYQKE